MNFRKLAIYAIHPIMYQAPIFSALQTFISTNHIPLEVTVLFGDDLSLKPTYFKETNVVFKPDTPNLLSGYNYKFIKNLAKDPRKGFYSRINPGILGELKKNKYDALLIHGYESLTAWFAVISAHVLGIKVIWRGEATLRDNEQDGGLKNLFKRFILKMFFCWCDALMYSCSGNKDFLLYYGVNPKKMFFIPCAVDNEFFLKEREKYKDTRMVIRSEIGIKQKDLCILFSARFTSRKRPLDLIRAVAEIAHENIVILFVGDGPEKTNMKTCADALEVKTIFAGFKNQSEISKYYAAADLNVVLSDYDPSPKALNEAMLFSLPLIVTDIVGTAYDLVKPKENGFIVPVGDIIKISQAIDDMNKNRLLLKSMGQKSYAIVQDWNYPKDVEGILSAVNSVFSADGNKK